MELTKKSRGKLPKLRRREVKPQHSGAEQASRGVQDGHMFNLQLAEDQTSVDKINKKFYERFNFPPPPMWFDSVSDPTCGTTMLNQELGNWAHDRIPRNAKIWVAGCGTNQAIYTALKFPESEVLGTDLSSASLETCKSSAEQLGIGNLKLEEKSINQVTYQEEFDFVICTGVVHHNAKPELAIKKLAGALKPHGVLEFMVYNYYHRFLTTAFQRAIRILCGGSSVPDFELELLFTKKLMEDFPFDSIMQQGLDEVRTSSESNIADAMLQPVEYSYTAESMNELIRQCGLEIALPCVNQYDKAIGTANWNADFSDPDMARKYLSLPDLKRWEITNLLAFNVSPMLWFYLQREDCVWPRKSEKQVAEDFLKTRFERVVGEKKIYRQGSDGYYGTQPEVVPFPAPQVPRDELARRCLEAVEPSKTMSEVFEELSIEASFLNAHRARLHLTTWAYPYLKAVGSQR